MWMKMYVKSFLSAVIGFERTILFRTRFLYQVSVEEVTLKVIFLVCVSR